MDLKEKQKLYILFAVFGVAAMVFYFNLLLKPQFSRFIVHNREYYSIKRRVNSGRALIANEARIQVHYESLKKETELLEKGFPGQDEVPTLLEDFSRIAESSDVKILRIKPLEVLNDVTNRSTAAGGFYAEFPILIEAMAGYHQCGVFINKIENMDRFIKIDEVDISARSASPRSHDIRLRVIAYVMR